MAAQNPRILLAGGGTGGHLFPALAIADEVRKIEPAAELLFIGTKNKIEARVVPQRGYPFQTIWISGLHRRLTLDNLLFPVKVAVSLVQSFVIIKRFQPDVVVGTGGYVCGPILSVATWFGIPTVLHESNSYPGFTTRLLAGRVNKVFTAFDATMKWLKRTDNVEVVGTPTRESLGIASKEDGRGFFNLDQTRKTVLVLGGSLGATSVNNAVLGSIEELLAAGIQLIWQTGQRDIERVKQAIGSRSVGWLGAFIDRMEYAFAAADIVVCRAGATTLAELTRVGKPAILVPYPHAAADHQTHNAKAMVDGGAGLMIADADASQKLKPAILDLLKDQRRLARMREASLTLGKPEAGRRIAEMILQFTR